MTQEEKEQLAREYWESRFEYLAQFEPPQDDTIYYWNDCPPVIDEKSIQKPQKPKKRNI